MTEKNQLNIFPKWTNKIPLVLAVVGLGAVVAGHVFFIVFGSPKFYEMGYEPDQPIPYSHKLHAGTLGIDCKYCHMNAETGNVASVPALQVCMNCHAGIKKDSPKLAKLYEAWNSGKPEEAKALSWVKVHRLPDFVTFPHKAHVQAGLKCQECHGPVETMDVVKVSSPLSMGWCLECHRRPRGLPESSTRITKLPFDMMADHGGSLFQAHTIPSSSVNPPTHCSGCHQ